jgi:hypothetical protein
MSPGDALELSARLSGLNVALQTLELLLIRDALSDRGIWRFSNLERELRGLWLPLRWLALAALPYRAFLGLLGVQLAGALLLLGAGQSLASLVLALTSLLVCVRFRGSFNGGSDAMTLLVLLALGTAALFPRSQLAAHAALLYIALQAALSYLVAGAIKLRQSAWREGRALRELFALPQYAVPRAAQALAARPALGRVGTWSVLLFECSFPLALLGPQLCAPLLALALLFHCANAALLGLNRFLWAWAAAYPALYYVSQLGPLAQK